MICMEVIRGYPYMRKKQLMEEFQVSRTFVDNKVKGIYKEIQAGRYGTYAILEGIGMINAYVFIDYMKYEKALADRNARKYVPPFRPDEVMELCGYNQKAIQIDEETA